MAALRARRESSEAHELFQVIPHVLIGRLFVVQRLLSIPRYLWGSIWLAEDAKGRENKL